jgi:hypothetical protein
MVLIVFETIIFHTGEHIAEENTDNPDERHISLSIKLI